MNSTFKIRNLDLWDTQQFRELAKMEEISEIDMSINIKQILEIKAYYDKESEIYYGVIKIRTQPIDHWYYVFDFLTARAENYKMFKEYQNRTEVINKYYPVLSEQKIKKYKESGVVTSVDPSAQRKFQVVFENGSTIDVKQQEIEGMDDDYVFQSFQTIALKPLGVFAPLFFARSACSFKISSFNFRTITP